MQQLLITASSLLVFVCYAVYIRAMLKKQAKPNRMTRFVLLIITAVATASLLAQGSETTIWLIGSACFFSLLLFIMSFKYGMGGTEKLDIICLLIAIGGIVIWISTNNAFYALVSSIIADFAGMVPTLRKTYLLPHTEVWYFNFLAGLASIFTLAALPEYSLMEVIYPVYLVIINFAMSALVLRPKYSKLIKK